MQIASLKDRVRLWHGLWAHNELSGENIPVHTLGTVHGLYFSDSGQPYVNCTSGVKWLSSLCLHHLYARESGMRAFSKVPGASAWKQENITLEGIVWLAPVGVACNHGLLSVEFRVRRSALPWHGSSTWVYLATLHKQLQLQCCHSAMTWVGKAASGWQKWLQQSMHVHATEFQVGAGACGSRNLLEHDCAQHVSVNALLLLCSRWLSSHRAGLRNVEDREKITQFLDALLAQSLQGAEVPVICKQVEPSETEGRFPILQVPVLKMSLSQRGVLVSTLPRFILDHVPVQSMSTEENRIRLPVLLRVCYEQKALNGVLQQVCLQVGAYIDRALWCLAWDSTPAEATHRLEAMRFNAQYLMAGREALQFASNFSLAVDASRVGKRKVLMGVIASASAGVATIVPPQDSERKINQVPAIHITLKIVFM
eukprot:6491738-Amphidinium_carterae.3